MNLVLAALLLPLHFTAPADSVGPDATGRVRLSANPVHSYIFHQLDSKGTLTAVPGYADSLGRTLLAPHAPGTREKVWLAQGVDGRAVTIFVLSRDSNGNLSAPSNGCLLGTPAAPASLAIRRAAWTVLGVPVVSQERERCGPAALAMVLGYYGARPEVLRLAETAYDPVLRGSLITDLAGAARRAGYEAAIETLTPDSIIELLGDGVPPILLYQNGRGPVTAGHFGVVTGWDASRDSFTLHDGTARPVLTRRDDLAKRWETAGSQALIVRLREPE
jgi:hypothetical protein